MSCVSFSNISNDNVLRVDGVDLVLSRSAPSRMRNDIAKLRSTSSALCRHFDHREYLCVHIRDIAKSSTEQDEICG